MEIKIYIDVLWLINFIINNLLIWITSLLLHQPRRVLRSSCASALGALYAVCMFFWPLSFLWSLVGALFLSIIMIAIAFRPRGFKALMKYLCVFYAVTFVLGGTALSIFYMADNAAITGTVIRNGIIYFNFPVYRLLPIAAGCFIILKTAFHLSERLNACQQLTCKVRIQYHGNAVTLRGFYDSGNLLCDPVTGRGVIIANLASLAPLLNEDISTPMTEYKTLSCHTLQGDTTLKAFMPDAINAGTGHTLQRLSPVYEAVTTEFLNH